jgi:hypothetical protein
MTDRVKTASSLGHRLFPPSTPVFFLAAYNYDFISGCLCLFSHTMSPTLIAHWILLCDIGSSSSLNTTLPSTSAWSSIRASNYNVPLSSTAQSTSGGPSLPPGP